MSQLTINNLTVGYDNRLLIENLSFSVNQGDYLCILGANGTGKSTLMKVLLSLKKPIHGDILLDGSITRKQFGYLTQQKDLQKDFPASVREIVLSGCQSQLGLRPFYNRTEKALAEQSMERLDILPLQKRCFAELSGGQQQRVLLARALCASKKILFLDEPVTGLDPRVTQDFYDIIQDLNQQDKLSIVMISHDVETALKHASHILHIGETPFFGTKEAYLESEYAHLFQSKQGGMR